MDASAAGPIRSVPRRRLQPPASPKAGKYLGFVRQLQDSQSDRTRCLSLRAFQGDVFVCIRDSNPEKVCETVIDEFGRRLFSKGLNLTQAQWYKLTTPLMREWVERGILCCRDDTLEGFNSLDSPDESETVLTEDGERCLLIEKNKWVTIKKFSETVYVTLREFYFSDYLGKVVPGRGITLNLYEWNTLCEYIPEVNTELEIINQNW